MWIETSINHDDDKSGSTPPANISGNPGRGTPAISIFTVLSATLKEGVGSMLGVGKGSKVGISVGRSVGDSVGNANVGNGAGVGTWVGSGSGVGAT